MAGIRALHILGGEPYAHPVEFLDETTENPVDTTGWTIQAAIKRNAHVDDPPLVTFAIDTTNLTQASGALAVLTLTAAEADTVASCASSANPAVWDLQVTVGGVPATFLKGPVTAEPDVTP